MTLTYNFNFFISFLCFCASQETHRLYYLHIHADQKFERFDLMKLILKCDSVLKIFQIFFFHKNSFVNIDNYKQWTILLRCKNHRQKEEKWENGISSQMGRIWRSYMGTREEHPQSHHRGVSKLTYFSNVSINYFLSIIVQPMSFSIYGNTN